MNKATLYAQDNDGDIEIRFEDGEYFISEPINISSDDFSGNKLTITGADAGLTTINGGAYLTDWRKEDNLYVTEINENVVDIRELYINGRMAKRASTKTAVQITGDLANGSGFKVSKGALTDEELNAIDTATELEGIMDISWVRQRIEIDSCDVGDTDITVNADQTYQSQLSDPSRDDVIAPIYETERTSYNGNLCNGTNYWEEKKEFYFENALGLLDEAGEFYYDKYYNLLYYYPLADEVITEAVIPVTQGFININGTKEQKVTDITVKNLKFTYGTWLAPSDECVIYDQAGYILGGDRMFSQIQVNYADNVKIKNVSMENVSTNGIDFYEGVTNAKITECFFNNIGASAVSVGPFDYTKASETICKNITVSNNEIDTVGYVYGGHPAISLYYVNNTKALHNDINNTTYTGISLGWGWGNDVLECAANEIAYNKITDVMNKYDDGGFIYTLGDCHSSTIHDNYMNGQVNWGGGLYFDSGSKNIDVLNNVVLDCVGVMPDGKKSGWFITTVVENSNINIENIYTDDTQEYTSEYISIKNVVTSDFADEAAQILANAGKNN